MTHRFSALAGLLALLLAFVAPAVAQGETAASPTVQPMLEHVAIETELGTILLALDAANAPITTANFLRYADEKRFDGTSFYRVMSLDWGTPPNGLIQGGTNSDPKRNLPGIPHEPTTQTGIRHTRGAISMARFEPGTAAGDFSILVSPQPGLDAQPEAEDPSTQLGYAAFGHVVRGMNVVEEIFGVPMSTTKGEGFMRGQMIEDPVKILTVRRVPAPEPEPEPEPQSAPVVESGPAAP